MSEIEEKKLDDIPLSDLMEKLNKSNHQIDFLKYFTNNGYKECQFLKTNENDEKKDSQVQAIKAWDKSNKKYVVIKVHNTIFTQETVKKINDISQLKAEFVQSYVQQATVIFDQFIYYSKEFQSKGDLKKQFIKDKVNIDFAERITCKILIGLEQIHNKQSYHGRIKLENVLLDHNESILLTDYCIGEDDGFFLEEKGEVNLNIEKFETDEQIQKKLEKRQIQDLYRVGVMIIYLCDILKDKEKELDEYIRYNTKRTYKLLGISKQLMEMDNLQNYHCSSILEKLNYFEGKFLSFYLGVEKYEGEVKNKKKHGKGIYRYANGNIVVGTWVDDTWQKNGVIYYQNGDILDKGYTEEDFNNSVLIWKNQQAIYEGYLKDLRVNGKGSYKINGITQTGIFEGGKLQGYGEIYYKNHDVYRGNFEGHKKTGYGEMFWGIGQIYKGNFTKDKITGRGYYIFPDGSEYFGEIEDGFFHGFGKLYWASGCYYEGYWSKHEKNGYGKYYTSYNQQIYEGKFLKNLMEGEGKLTLQDGTEQIGIWKKNVYVPDSHKQVTLEKINYNNANHTDPNKYSCTIF